jgi:hypothetical protein
MTETVVLKKSNMKKLFFIGCYTANLFLLIELVGVSLRQCRGEIATFGRLSQITRINTDKKTSVRKIKRSQITRINTHNNPSVLFCAICENNEALTDFVD